MALNLPTAKQLADQNLTFLQNRLGQNSPLADKSFLRVISVLLALMHTELYKYAAERALQNLALTASGDDLDTIGTELAVIRQAATKTVLTASLAAETGTLIPATASFISNSTGERYFMQFSVTAALAIAYITLVAEDEGVTGNLDDGELLTITSSIPGADNQAVVAPIPPATSSILTTGAEEESDDDYRVRVLEEIRRVGGGSNSSDYRSWSQEVSGVRRTYPFSGKPWGSSDPSYPPDRTLYVEATPEVDPDGVPPSGLLDQVRAQITIDPKTGLSRQALGLTDQTLFVNAITPISLYMQVQVITIDDFDETVARDAIEAAMLAFVPNIRNWISGLDPDGERFDLITSVLLAQVVQDALTPLNGTAERIFFGISPFEWIDEYRLHPGEILILGAIDYV